MDEAMFSQAVPSMSGQREILQVSLSLMSRAGIPNVLFRFAHPSRDQFGKAREPICRELTLTSMTLVTLSTMIVTSPAPVVPAGD
jgi:hypothetical protein